jgi:hypothetical protein
MTVYITKDKRKWKIVDDPKGEISDDLPPIKISDFNVKDQKRLRNIVSPEQLLKELKERKPKKGKKAKKIKPKTKALKDLDKRLKKTKREVYKKKKATELEEAVKKEIEKKPKIVKTPFTETESKPENIVIEELPKPKAKPKAREGTTYSLSEPDVERGESPTGFEEAEAMQREIARKRSNARKFALEKTALLKPLARVPSPVSPQEPKSPKELKPRSLKEEPSLDAQLERANFLSTRNIRTLDEVKAGNPEITKKELSIYEKQRRAIVKLQAKIPKLLAQKKLNRSALDRAVSDAEREIDLIRKTVPEAVEHLPSRSESRARSESRPRPLTAEEKANALRAKNLPKAIERKKKNTAEKVKETVSKLGAKKKEEAERKKAEEEQHKKLTEASSFISPDELEKLQLPAYSPPVSPEYEDPFNPKKPPSKKKSPKVPSPKELTQPYVLKEAKESKKGVPRPRKVPPPPPEPAQPKAVKVPSPPPEPAQPKAVKVPSPTESTRAQASPKEEVKKDLQTLEDELIQASAESRKFPESPWRRTKVQTLLREIEPLRREARRKNPEKEEPYPVKPKEEKPVKPPLPPRKEEKPVKSFTVARKQAEEFEIPERIDPPSTIKPDITFEEASRFSYYTDEEIKRLETASPEERARFRAEHKAKEKQAFEAVAKNKSARPQDQFKAKQQLKHIEAQEKADAPKPAPKSTVEEDFAFGLGKGLGGKLKGHQVNKFVEASYKNLDDANEVDGYVLDRDLSTKNNKVYRDPNTGKVVIANAGTSSLGDWWNNKNILFGNYSKTKRYKEVEDIQKRAIQKYGKENIMNVGHSQSGEALRIMKERQLLGEAVAVNPAIIGKPTGDIDVIRSNRDVVSFLTPTNEKDTVIQAQSFNPLTEHSSNIISGENEEKEFGRGLAHKSIFNKIHWGAFTKQFKAYKRTHPHIRDLEDFASHIISNPNQFNHTTLHRAMFYENVIRHHRSEK